MDENNPLQKVSNKVPLPDDCRLLFRISSEFIDITAEHMDEAIERHLKEIMAKLDLERMMIIRYVPEEQRMCVSHSIVMEGIVPFPRGLVFTQEFVDKMQAGQELLVYDQELFLLDIGPERRPGFFNTTTLERLEQLPVPLHSSVMMPLCYAGDLVGAFCFGTAFHPMPLSDESLSFMRHLASIFARALGRRLRDDRLQAAYTEINQLKRQLLNENASLRQEIARNAPETPIVGRSATIKKLLNSVETVAPTRATVLIHGETGVGKELVARMVHQSSPRHDKQMVVVNCGAIPGNLFESEFFGKHKGAYTGADRSMPGKFEVAHGSTLYLDEVGELSLEAQAKLLRVLEGGVFERLGSNKPIEVDVRVIAATNRNLEQMVREKLFRDDLYFRLNMFPLYVPSLREHQEDIPALVWNFVHLFEKEFGKIINNIQPKTMQRLKVYSWPGNIRELKNIIARAVLNSPAETLEVELPGSRQGQGASLAIKDVEREHIRKVLEATNWKVGGPGNAAELLDINRTTLLSRMKKLGLSKPSP